VSLNAVVWFFTMPDDDFKDMMQIQQLGTVHLLFGLANVHSKVSTLLDIMQTQQLGTVFHSNDGGSIRAPACMIVARVCLSSVLLTQSSLEPNSRNARVTRPGSGLGGFLHKHHKAPVSRVSLQIK
jgi:hypothetical protein